MTRMETTGPLTIDPLEASARLLAMTINHGTVMARGACPMDGVADECWTNAWKARGETYCEGAIRWPNGKWTTHGWTLGPFGTVIEHTPGYADAVEYRGFVISRTSPAALATKGWTGWRSSILEAALANVAPETLLDGLL